MFTHKRRLGASLTVVAAAASMMLFGIAAPASADDGYKLKLISLQCLQTEDAGPHDEAYLTVNGDRVWKADVTEGSPIELNVEEDLPYVAWVQLWDADTGIIDKDDFLGQLIVTADLAGKGAQPFTFNEDGAEYRLIYEVVRG